MICQREGCNNELPSFYNIRIKKRQIEGEEPEEYDFCSVNCAEQYLNGREDANNFRFYEVLLCAAYYHCKKLDNLRNGCEREQSIENVGPYQLPEMPLQPICTPGEAGLILATCKFDETSTRLNEQMLSHTKTMKLLTWAILAFTIFNLILIAIQIYLSFKTW
jgi:hypothetical protein